MSTMFYGGAHAPGKAVSKGRAYTVRKSLLQRFMDALAMSRIRQARHMIELYAHLLKSDRDTLAFDECRGQKPQ